MDKANQLKDRGNQAFTQGNFQAAIEYYTQALAAHPEATFYSNRAACYIYLKQFEKAIVDARKAIEMDPKIPKPYYRLSQALMAQGKLNEAFEVLGTGLVNNPNETNMRREHDTVHILLGYKTSLDKLIQAEEYGEALKKAASLLEKCENDFEILCKTIDLHCRNNDIPAALALLSRRQTFINSISPAKYVALSAAVDRYSNKIEDAKTKLQAGARAHPDNHQITSELRHVLKMESTKAKATEFFKAKNYHEAIRLYDECFNLDRTNHTWKAVMLSNKATCFAALKDIKQARDLMRKSTELDPTNGKNFYKRGKYEMELKEWDAAEECLKKAKTIDPTLKIDTELKQVSAEVVKANDKDYYEILGLKKGDGQDKIKKAYKELVRKWHPDKHAGGRKEDQDLAEKKFKLINEANDVLSDPQKKQMYDLGGGKQNGGGSSGGPGFQSGSGNFKDFQGFEDMGGFHSMGGANGPKIFQMFFNNGSSNNFSFGTGADGFGDFGGFSGFGHPGKRGSKQSAPSQGFGGQNGRSSQNPFGSNMFGPEFFEQFQKR